MLEWPRSGYLTSTLHQCVPGSDLPSRESIDKQGSHGVLNSVVENLGLEIKNQTWKRSEIYWNFLKFEKFVF